MESTLTIPKPLDWQLSVLDDDRKWQESINCIVVGRRAGKSHLALLWLFFAPGGLSEGKPVCLGSATDAHLADIRAIFRQWFWPLIKGPSPGGLGFELENGSRCDFWSLAPGHNAFRGRGYSLAVLDECGIIRNLTATIEQNLMPSLAQYQGRLMLTGTPKGFNDFHAWFRRAERDGLTVQGATTLNPLVSQKWLDERRKEMPELVYQQEILSQFVTIEGGLLKRSEIKLGTPPPLDRFLTLSLGLDFALTEKKSGDFSAAVLAGVDEARRTWILHAEHWRSSWPQTFERVLALNEQFKPHVCMTESVAFSELCVRELAASGIPIDAIKPSVDKIARFSPIHMRYRLGQITHSVSLDQEFEDEILSFPEGHDDFTDSLVYAITALDRTIRSEWAIDRSSGEQWGRGRLPHEKRKGTWGFDFWGMPHLVGGEDDYDEAAQGSAPNPESEPVPTQGKNSCVYTTTHPTSTSSTPTPSHGGVCIHSAKTSSTSWLPEFYEKIVGDEFIVLARDSGKELMRAHRSKMPFYQGLKNAGQLDWQLKGIDGYIKTL